MGKLIRVGGAIIGLLIPGVALAAMDASGPKSDQNKPGFAQPVSIVGAVPVGGAMPVTLAHGWTTVYVASSTNLPVTLSHGWSTVYVASSTNLPVTLSHGWSTVYVASSTNLPVTLSHGWSTVYLANSALVTTVMQDSSQSWRVARHGVFGEADRRTCQSRMRIAGRRCRRPVPSPE